jgi:L-lactate dehydrogenase complex protein LldF
VTPLVHHPPDATPHPDVAGNVQIGSAHWARSREAVKATLDWEAWRERAAAIRADAVEHQPELLERLVERATAAGVEVHRAATGEEANARIVEICRRVGATLAVKGKSMTGEETGLSEALQAAGVEPVETDLGEYIVQALGDRPSHILTPAIHLNARQVADLFSRLSGRQLDASDPESLVRYARGALRERFLEADVGITGANMAVAETGTIVLVESEGNLRLSTSLPRVHIALMGIEKVVRDWAGAAHLIETLPLAAQGRRAAGSTSLVHGPARDGDDGPREIHLVLLDNGRSAIRGTAFEDVLRCIRCGACLYACPVYAQVGGHAYGAAYPGPIGSVVTPLLADLQDGTGEMPWMSSLCGACAEACPVKIPLDDQLVALRAEGARRSPKRAEAALFDAWSRLWSRPAGYRATLATGGRALGPAWAKLAGAIARGDRGGRDGEDGEWIPRAPFPFSGWTHGRDIRKPSREPFHRRWAQRRGKPAPPPVALPEAAPPPAAEPPAHDAHPEPSAAEHPPGDVVDRFAATATAHGATVRRCADATAARAAIAELIGTATVAGWVDPLLDTPTGRPTPAADAEISLVRAGAGVADTGVFMLVHGPGRPRGAGILPPRQIVLLAETDVRATTPDALAHVGASSADPPASVVLVAGPSRTSDIEHRTITGVHAPREVTIVLHGS